MTNITIDINNHMRNFSMHKPLSDFLMGRLFHKCFDKIKQNINNNIATVYYSIMD